MSRIRLKEYLNPMHSRQSKISFQVQQTPSRINWSYDHIIPLLQMNGITVLLLRVIPLISRRFCRLYYGGIPFIRTASVRSLHIQCFYTWGKLTSCNVDTNISHQKWCGFFERKINNTEHPSLLCDTSQRYPQHRLPKCGFVYKNTPKLPL